MTIEATGRINAQGRLVMQPDERAAFLEQISRNAGRDVEIVVRAGGRRRSPWQNNYYYGVVVSLVRDAVSEEWGESLTKDETHQLLKQHCNWKEHVNETTGEAVKVAQSTVTLSTVEFEEYLERCRRFAAEFLNVYVPLPNEQLSVNL